MEEIVNRVTQSGIQSLDLEELYVPGERVFYDLAENLYMGLILKEKDFRQFLKEHDWEQYKGKHVAVGCTVDAIIPTWAYMLLAIHLEAHASTVAFGNLEDLEKQLYATTLANFDLEQFRDARVVIKGCSDKAVPTWAYVEITGKLKPIAKSLMYGEPCSTVPLFKKK